MPPYMAAGTLLRCPMDYNLFKVLQCTMRQYPICAGYVFTDHKAQGQMLEHVLIDIGTTKKFPVTPFSAYGIITEQGPGLSPVIEGLRRHYIRLWRT